MRDFNPTLQRELPLTPGQHAVDRDFNPSGRSDVAQAKSLFAQAYDLVNSAGSVVNRVEREAALTAIVTAQMWTVKVLTRQPQ